MKRDQVFQSKYLGKEQVKQPLVAVIRDVRIEQMTSDEDAGKEKAVLYFADQQIKPMVLNATNWSILEEAYGDDSDGWHGHIVEVFYDTAIIYKGKRTGGMRVRIPSSSPNQTKASGAVWKFPQAIEECKKVGLSEADLKTMLKARGLAGYNAERDTPTVQEIIRDAKATSGAQTEESFDDGSSGDDVPF